MCKKKDFGVCVCCGEGGQYIPSLDESFCDRCLLDFLRNCLFEASLDYVVIAGVDVHDGVV